MLDLRTGWPLPSHNLSAAISQPRRSAWLLAEQAALFVAQNPEWEAEIVLADELQPSGRPDPVGRILRDIPAVDPGAAEPAIAARRERAVQAQVLHHVLDQDEARPPAR